YTLGQTPDLLAPVAIYDGDIDGGLNVAAAKTKGYKVVCYVNVGSLENDPSFRPDYSKFPASVIGNSYPGWDERFLDIRSSIVRMKNAGCDGIEPDNTDSYTYDTGFGLTAQNALDYVMWISTTVHNLNMAVGLKNNQDLLNSTPTITTQIVGATDFALLESCYKQNICAQSQPYIKAGKPVFDIEYTDAGAGGCDTIPATSISTMCASMTKSYQFETFVKDCNLGNGYSPCWTTYVKGYRVPSLAR
ncbi:hypothetical protein HDU76_001157, partial [Blyttiomyces sp. JEL0837]